MLRFRPDTTPSRKLVMRRARAVAKALRSNMKEGEIEMITVARIMEVEAEWYCLGENNEVK